jgi:hypothetical protein
VDFAGAGYLAWTNLNKSYQRIVTDYAVAFFDRYLKGLVNPNPLTHLPERPWPGDVSEVRYFVR